MWLWGTRIVSRREELLDATTVLDAAALDRYEFLRDAYLQRRRNLIYDGRPPLDKDLDIAPPKDQKGDVDARDKAVAAIPAVEGSMAASEDHVPQIAVRAPELDAACSRCSRSCPMTLARSRSGPKTSLP